MAVEFWYSGTAVITAAAMPVILVRGLGMWRGWAVALTIPIALVIGELIFRFAKPDFHYGPLDPLGIIMTGFIALIVASVVTALLKSPSKP